MEKTLKEEDFKRRRLLKKEISETEEKLQNINNIK